MVPPDPVPVHLERRLLRAAPELATLALLDTALDVCTTGPLW